MRLPASFESVRCVRAVLDVHTHTYTCTPHHRSHHATHRAPPRSEMRQVPDNQEVFVDGASDASLILELLELERGRPGPEVGYVCMVNASWNGWGGDHRLRHSRLYPPQSHYSSPNAHIHTYVIESSYPTHPIQCTHI